MEANSHRGTSQCATETYKQMEHKPLLIPDMYPNFYSKTALDLHFLGKPQTNVYICHHSLVNSNTTVSPVISLIRCYPPSCSESMWVLL